MTFWVGPSTCSPITVPPLVTRYTSSPSYYTPNRSPHPFTQRYETSKAVSDEEISNMIHTTMQISTELESSDVITVTAPILLLLLVLVGAVVVVFVLLRCRHQHTAKEEASHTSNQTHTHTLLSACVRRQDRFSMSQSNRTQTRTACTAPYHHRLARRGKK